jgi:hypothetical protein
VCEACCLGLGDYLKQRLFKRRVCGCGGEVTRSSEKLHVNELHEVEYATTVFGNVTQIVEMLI